MDKVEVVLNQDYNTWKIAAASWVYLGQKFSNHALVIKVICQLPYWNALNYDAIVTTTTTPFQPWMKSQ
jgi:hypothetical protein